MQQCLPITNPHVNNRAKSMTVCDGNQRHAQALGHFLLKAAS